MDSEAPKSIRQKIGWDNEVIEIINILPEDFPFRYDGVDYLLKSGETKSYPRFIAIHAAKHMVDREIIDQYKTSKLRDAKLRAEITKKIWVRSEDEEIIEEVEEVVEEVTKSKPKVEKTGEMTKNEMVKKLTMLGGKWDPKDNKDDLKRKIKSATKEN